MLFTLPVHNIIKVYDNLPKLTNEIPWFDVFLKKNTFANTDLSALRDLPWNTDTGGAEPESSARTQTLLCASERSTKQRGEKGPHLPEAPLHKEQEINSTFFSSFTASFTFFYPHPWSPHCQVGQRPEGWRRGKCGGEFGSRRKGGSAEGVEAHLIRGWMMQVSGAWGGKEINDEQFFYPAFKLSL